MKLIGDIGGTKVLLALADAAGTISQKCRLASADFARFDDLVGEYLRGQSVAIDGGCLAVAGPVSDDGRTAKITNLPWTIDTSLLEQRFGLGRLTLINDFAGVAAGVACLPPDQRITLQAGVSIGDGVRLVIGAGTGLGMAILDGDTILPSEGGHVGFAPTNDTEVRLWSALMALHGRVTAERVISGPGLAAIHRVLTGKDITPAAISEQALAGEHAALATVEAFFAAYGAFAGDMAMAVMARGGVYLAGGVTQRLLPLLPRQRFLDAFNAKAEHADLVRTFPVHVVTDPDVGLHGAYAKAI